MIAALRRLVDRRLALVALAVVVTFGFVARVQFLVALSASGGGSTVAIAYDPAESAKLPYIRDAYEEFFREQGIPHKWVTVGDVMLLPSEALAREFSAIVFPDRIDERLGSEVENRLTDYVEQGGVLVVVQDAGQRDDKGFFRRFGVFDKLLGVHYVRYQQQPHAFVHGTVKFDTRAQGELWGFPFGKIDDDGYLTGYLYGRLTYALNEAVAYAANLDVAARSGKIPVVATRAVGRGSVAYVDLALGALKASGDSMPMQALLRSVLFAYANVPHLIAAPDGVGRIIVNLHVDSNAEWAGIPNLARERFLRKDVPMEFDVTAGPDLSVPGDDRGFDACGTGRPYLEEIARYGTIGDHGGWDHNLFARELADGELDSTQLAALIDRNSLCLESVTGKPVRSYAAPVGLHPQPSTTDVLQRLGIDGYYYTGDTGSSVLRPFFDGRFVSGTVWAFPVMPLGSVASLAEMAKAHIAPSTVSKWLDSTLSYASDRRSIQLLYSHVYDLKLHPQYDAAFGAFLNQIERDERNGTLYATTMPAATAFMQRYIQTTFAVARGGGDVSVDLSNPQGLHGIAFALPESDVGDASPVAPQLRDCGTDDGYHIYAVRSNATHLHLAFRR